jgi:ribosome maturation factor RimP
MAIDLAPRRDFTILPQKSHMVRFADRLIEKGVGGSPLFCFIAGAWSNGRQARVLGTEKINEIVEPSLEAMGYRLVRTAFTGGRRPTLQIMAERRDGGAMTVEDCAEISRNVSALLDVADPIQAAYMLEVSSPGIDRPLVAREDYERFAGHEAKIELNRPIEGRKRFRGRLLGVGENAVRLALEEGQGEVRLPLADIAKAKLVLTDALLEAARRGQAG